MESCATAQKRINWIDYLKGITIFCVVLFHTPGCIWLTDNHLNTVFFFLAGMFFKPRPFGEFARRHVYGLLIPFSCFYLLSYPLRLLFDVWGGVTFSDLSWDLILNVFAVRPEETYIFVNIPLWFLLCLFWVQIFYYGVNRLPKWGRVAVLTAIWLLWDVISQIPSPFMWNNAVCYLLYFGLGNLTGKSLIHFLKDKRILLPILAAGAVTVFYTDVLLQNTFTACLYYMIWCLSVLALASTLRYMPRLEWLGFIGRNTIVIIGLHMFVIQILFNLQSSLDIPASILSAVVTGVICISVLVPVIHIVNRHMPAMAGKCNQASLNRLSTEQ